MIPLCKPILQTLHYLVLHCSKNPEISQDHVWFNIVCTRIGNSRIIFASIFKTHMTCESTIKFLSEYFFQYPLRKNLIIFKPITETPSMITFIEENESVLELHVTERKFPLAFASLMACFVSL